MSERRKKETAAVLYKEEKVSLARAASIAGVSLTGMKEILMEKGIKPRLGVEGVRELKEDCETLKINIGCIAYKFK